MLQTEYEFTLPRGYVDNEGTIHRSGVMRLACAADEIEPLRDPRVQQTPEYLMIVILSRVITKFGTLPKVHTEIIEKLYTADLCYLQDMYQRINEGEIPTCPKCGEAMYSR